MEVKPGYKQTEVGVIPEHWDVANLGAVCEIFGRIGFRGYTEDDIVEKGKGAITISPSNIQDNKTDFAKCSYLSWPKYEESPEIKIYDGDILLVKTGSTFGKTAIVQNLNEKATLNPQVVVLKKIRINNFFLGYMMGFETIQNQITSTIVGGAIPTLSQNLVAQFTLPVPRTTTEQDAIAGALIDVDALLGALDQLIAKKRDLKQAAMQQLLTGQTRLPSFHGEWEVKTVAELADVSKGTQLHSSETNDDGTYPHLNGGISASGFTHKSNTPGNTIAISEGGNSCGYVQLVPKPFWCGGHCYAVAPKGIDKLFLYHALKGSQTAIMGLRVGSGLPNVQKTALAAFKLRVPTDLPEQTAIAEVLSDMDAELAALEQRRDKTRALKQGMMQELLTGRTRLI
jgi:type I restriction enzyme S subunit